MEAFVILLVVMLRGTAASGALTGHLTDGGLAPPSVRIGMRLKLLNLVSASYDGSTWLLSAKELVDDEGRVVATDADRDWRKRLHELGVTESPLSKDTFVYYNDNPAVYGVPDAEIRVGKTTFRVADLAQDASQDGEESAPVLWAEV